MTKKRILSLFLALVTMISVYALVTPAQAASAQLSAPKLSSVTATASGVTVSWGAVNGAAKYRVFYKTGSGSWKKIADTAATSYTWAGAKSGTSYTFTVRCVTDDGASFTSPYDTVGKSIAYIAAPKISSVACTNDGMQITWGKVGGAAKYRVFYHTGSGSWKKIADTASTSYTWKGAQSGTTYTFTVRCVSSDGSSFTSPYDQAGKRATYLAAPQLTSVSNVGNGVSLRWAAVPGAMNYRVFYKTGSGSWKKIGDTASTHYDWNGGKWGAQYTFTVRCVSVDGKTFTSDYDRAGRPFTNLMDTPRIAEVGSIGSSLFINWSSVAGAKHYRLFYKIGSGSWKALADTTSCFYSWDTAKWGVDYAFTVRCLDDNGSYASDYDHAGYRFSRLLNTPKITNVTHSSSGLHISWTSVPNASRYRLFYKTGSGSWKALADTDYSYYLWDGAKWGTNYIFTVRCLDGNGNYASDYDHAGYSFTNLLPTPRITEVSDYGSYLHIAWDHVPFTHHYRVFYKVGSGSWTALTDTEYINHFWRGAKKGVKYTFTVRCVDGSGNYASDYDHTGYSYTPR